MLYFCAVFFRNAVFIQQVLYFCAVDSAFYSTKNTAFEIENAVYFYPLGDSHNDWGVSGFIKP